MCKRIFLYDVNNNFTLRLLKAGFFPAKPTIVGRDGPKTSTSNIPT